MNCAYLYMILLYRVFAGLQLYAKFFKYEFWLDRVRFLGHIMSEERVTVDPAKVEAFMSWK